MKNQPLGKRHKLCCLTDIEALFARRGAESADVRSALAYPLRAVWRPAGHRREGLDAVLDKMLVSIPKKRLRHAVDRVTMRRRVREAYRLTAPRPTIDDGALPHSPVDIAFIYVADEVCPSTKVRRSMQRLLDAIHPSTSTSTDAQCTVSSPK